MNIKPIKSDADYRLALRNIEGLMTAAPESAKGEKLDVMVTLIEAYEKTHFPLDLPDPHVSFPTSVQKSDSSCSN